MHALLMAMGAPASGGGAATGGSSMVTFVTFGLVILIFYFMIIRPQKKRDKEAKDMVASLKKGDKIVTIGGVYGTVVSVKETTAVIKVDDNTRIEFAKSAISSVINKKVEPVSAAKEKTASKKNAEVAAPEVVEAVEETTGTADGEETK